MKLLLLFAVLVFETVIPMLALDFESIQETYTKFNVDSKFDPAWTASVPFWYTPLFNKVDFYQNAEDFFGKEEFSKMTLADLEKTCPYFKLSSTTGTVYGFEGRSIIYDIFQDPIRNAVMHWGFRKNKDAKMEHHATTYTTLSDNKTFMVAVTLWSSGRKGFFVASTKQTLDGKTLQKIKKHLTDLEFDPKHFVETNYDNCSLPPSNHHSIEL